MTPVGRYFNVFLMLLRSFLNGIPLVGWVFLSSVDGPISVAIVSLLVCLLFVCWSPSPFVLLMIRSLVCLPFCRTWPLAYSGGSHLSLAQSTGRLCLSCRAFWEVLSASSQSWPLLNCQVSPESFKIWRIALKLTDAPTIHSDCIDLKTVDGQLLRPPGL